MKLITMIRKFEAGSGYQYESIYNAEEIEKIVDFELLDNSWSVELLENEPDNIDYEFWYMIENESGETIAESSIFCASNQ